MKGYERLRKFWQTELRPELGNAPPPGVERPPPYPDHAPVVITDAPPAFEDEDTEPGEPETA